MTNLQQLEMPGQTPRAPQEGCGEDSRHLQALDASQHATKDVTAHENGPAKAPKKYQNELAVIEQSEKDLQLVEKDLSATLYSQHSSTAKLADALRRVTEVIGRLHGYRNTVIPIEKKLEYLQDTLSGQKAGTPSSSPMPWSRVAAMGPVQGATRSKTVATHILRRQGGQDPHVTIKPKEELQGKLQGKPPSEMLGQIKGALPGAVAVRSLKSGDMRVTFASVASKTEAIRVADRAQEKLGARIVRPTYAVEVRGFPTRYPISHGKGADNSAIIDGFRRDSRLMYPGRDLDIAQVGWINGPKTAQGRKGARAPRAYTSLIMKVGSQELQREVVRTGLVLEGMHFEAVAFDESVIVERCYKC